MEASFQRKIRPNLPGIKTAEISAECFKLILVFFKQEIDLFTNIANVYISTI
jgi:hypothetical protein